MGLTPPDRIHDHDQFGWNLGYIAGEQERVALAAMNDNLRTEVRELRAEIASLRDISGRSGLVAPVPPRPTAPNPGVPEKRPRHPKDAA